MTDWKNESTEHINNRLNEIEKELADLKKQLEEGEKSDKDKESILKEIDEKEALQQILQNIKKDKESEEISTTSDTSKELNDLKESRATNQIENILAKEGIEWKLIENWKYNISIVKQYFSKILENISNQSSLISYLNENWRWCRSTCIQIALKHLWYDPKGVDGIIWIKTKAAISAFQENANISKDWKAWYNTTKALLDALNNTKIQDTEIQENEDDKKENTKWDDKKNSEGNSNEKITLKGTKTIKDISELPEWYKWDDPTYNYQLTVWNKSVFFYNNWRAMDVNRKMWNSANLVKNIKEWFYTYKKEEPKQSPEQENKEKLNFSTYSYVWQEINKLIKNSELNLKVSLYYNSALNPKATIYYQTKPISINFHNYIWNDDTLLKDKFIADVNKEIKAIDESKENDKKLNEFISSIRWKKYSIKDLYWKDDLWIKYGAFFGKFDDNKVEIDRSAGYTYKSWDVIKYNLDMKWTDATRCKCETPIDSIKDSQWNYSEAKFKEVLKQKIDEIVKDNF